MYIKTENVSKLYTLHIQQFFEISVFEISRVDPTCLAVTLIPNLNHVHPDAPAKGIA